MEPHGRYIEFRNEGLLPSDDPLEGLRRYVGADRQWNVYYRLSREGWRSFTPLRQVIHTGPEFHA